MKYHYYNIQSGITHTKTNTKRYVVAAVASLVMAGGLAIPAMALPQPPVSDNASPNACFGQERAAYAQSGPNGVLAPNSNGTYISQRKGTNPANNAAFIEQYCQ
ncbi:MAG TPA: hypothetical protein VLE74_02560 [Candidatus Saccharimonadales bacterium]|nr:hypothetical protein [Candidatus Saccharimonadales bacterium]